MKEFIFYKKFNVKVIAFYENLYCSIIPYIFCFYLNFTI